MPETLLITFREGLEAFLIVAIMLAYLTKTNRTNLIKSVYAGIAVALLISATTGWHVAGLAKEPVWEGSLALVAGAMVASFTTYIMYTAKNIRRNIGTSLERRASSGSAPARIGIFLFTVLMISREGMETALMLGALSAQNEPSAMIVGAVLGLAMVVMVGYLWSSQSQRINLRLFMQVTGVFLILFSVHLFAYGLHELSGISAIPLIHENGNKAVHVWSGFIEYGFFPDFIMFGLLGIPFGWLLISFVKDKLSTKHVSEAK